VRLLIDTRQHDPRERFDLWVEETRRLFFPLAGAPISKSPFAARVEGGRVGSVSVYRVAGDANRCWRTPRDVAQHDPEQVSLHLVRRGWCRLTQDDRSTRLGAGDMATFDTSRPLQLEASAGFELALFVVPKQILGGAADRICARTAARVAGVGGVGGPARAFLGHLADDFDDTTSGSAASDLADSVVVLLRALYQDHSAGEIEMRRPIATGLLRQVQAYVECHLDDVSLNPEVIARANNVSTRYLHKLFAMEEVSVSSWVRRRRLEGFRRDLLDPSLATCTISRLGERWGLHDAPMRSRAFREAYGCSPRELRARARSD
jgi:AraC-like DNA-binding protein